MQWSEQGIILATRRHGETGVIVDLFTRGHGRHLGLVRGGRSRRLRAVLQPGNSVAATWRARLEDHLGNYTVEPVRDRVAAVIDDPLKLSGLATLTALVQLIAEREAHERLFDALTMVLDVLDDDAVWPALMVRWELGLLEELGFGLDLASCAATGVAQDLHWVSPKTGRAVSADAGRPYASRLLALPQFLTESRAAARGVAVGDVVAGLALTGHFLDRHVFAPRGLRAPQARERLIERLRRQAHETGGPDR